MIKKKKKVGMISTQSNQHNLDGKLSSHYYDKDKTFRFRRWFILINIFRKQTKKDTDFILDEIRGLYNEIKRLNDGINESNDRIDCLQKSIALLYQILPDKLRQGIVDGLNERNRRSFLP